MLAPDAVARLPEHTLDLVVLHSVVQYLPERDAAELFALFRRLLNSGGTLIVSDVIPPHSSAITNARALLRFASANGFVAAALLGLVRTAFSDYRRLRARFGITCYDEAAMIAKLAAAGFAARSAPVVIGHDRSRLAFIARPSGAPASP